MTMRASLAAAVAGIHRTITDDVTKGRGPGVLICSRRCGFYLINTSAQVSWYFARLACVLRAYDGVVLAAGETP